jgi:hypothetical protein
MADNVGYTPGTGAKVATREVTYSGETANAQAVGLVTFDGADDAKTATDISPSNPLPIAAYGELVEALEAIASGTVTTVSTVSTVSAVSTLTNQSQIGGFAANDQIPSLMHMQADNLRRNIVVT